MASEIGAPTAHPTRALMATYVAAIFLGAALLFLIEPMFTKMVLPRLGGSPSVWSVAMVFFQAMLLLGYAYAHLLARYASLRGSVLAHAALMIAAALTLPLALGEGRPPASGQALWLIGVFATSIGLPFFALAANGPLLQAWFFRSDHPAAGDPYFLYAASNAGSFLALLSYPLLIEPFIPLSSQSRLWAIGFLVLIALIVAGGAWIWHAPSPGRPGRPEGEPGPIADDPSRGTGLWVPASAGTTHSATDAPTLRDGLIWCALAAVPSGLLIAVTAHISTDVAAVPLLWVLPLSLYLLTLVIVFQRHPLIPHRLAVALQPAFILVLVGVIVFDPVKTIIGMVAVHCGAFFVNALVCHGELARRRPPGQHLTIFYLWMAAGGMIGGIAAGLIAPYTFSWVAEYPILIVLAGLCRPGLKLPPEPRSRLAAIGMVLATVLMMVALHAYHPDYEETRFDWIIGSLLGVAVLFWSAPVPFAACIAVALFIDRLYIDSADTYSVRSFFGVARVEESADGRFRVLSHGTTMHGAERIRDANGNPVSGRPDLLTYYSDGSAMAQIMDAVRARNPQAIRYAVIGLGTGTLACRAQAADTVHYYEIDPAIIHIARDTGLFHFLSACRSDVPIMLGDARLTLGDAPDGAYDLIYVDAFTSDAIPIHLLTREAMALYLAKLAPHGIVAVHISNRYLELGSVVTGIATANGAVTRLNDGSDFTENMNEYLFTGTVAAVARQDADFGDLVWSKYWPRQRNDPSQWVWTDDYSNIVGAVIRQMRQ
ncbi:MAG TPA: fused MFS/spermidine synthase [Xanthobacteraceae bacterium]|nr:fused MFS/spermidine synthase [Xanthobacteraceae bacterium]